MAQLLGNLQQGDCDASWGVGMSPCDSSISVSTHRHTVPHKLIDPQRSRSQIVQTNRASISQVVLDTIPETERSESLASPKVRKVRKSESLKVKQHAKTGLSWSDLLSSDEFMRDALWTSALDQTYPMHLCASYTKRLVIWENITQLGWDLF